MNALAKKPIWELSVFQLKVLACLFMLIDHIGYILFPSQILWRAVGRLALPIFAYLIANGWRYTRNKLNYFLRLLVFALICHIPFYFFLPMDSLNIFFTLSLGLLAIALWEWAQKIRQKIGQYLLGGILVLAVAYFGNFLNVDYGWFGVLLIFSCHLFHNHWLLLGFTTTVLCFLHWLEIILAQGYYTAFNSIQFLCVGSFFILSLYKGKKGPPAKWLFYIFYPAHFLVLISIAIMLQYNFDWDFIFNRVIPSIFN